MKRASRIIAIFLLIVAGLFQYNLVVNRHAHLINGRIVYHSHPYEPSKSSSPYQNHTHSGHQFKLLHSTDNANVQHFDTGFTLPDTACVNLSNTLSGIGSSFITSSGSGFESLRAPPVCTL